jgi:hypothetical protein
MLIPKNLVLKLIPTEDFISLFIRMTCHLRCFETANETTLKMYDFIVQFYNTKFYFVLLVVYVMK